MKNKKLVFFILVLLICSAFAPQISVKSPFGSSSQVWIDAPLPSSHLPLAPIEIVAHATNPGGIASFQIKLNGQPLGTASPDPASFDPTLVFMRYTWQPPAPGTYLIEVQAIDKNDLSGAPADVTVVVVGKLISTPTPVVPAYTYTPTPVGIYFTDTPTPVGPNFTFTPTPVGVYFIPNANINCRSGPDRIFDVIDIALKGQTYLINGRNLANDWYYLKFSSSVYCWVLATTGTASGDTSKVRVMLPIPTPTGVASACSAFTSQSTCNAHPNCLWKPSISGPGVCANK
jgi:uncharacterized protein YgiM (DUF1202 family)